MRDENYEEDDPSPALLCCRDFLATLSSSELSGLVEMIVREVEADTVEVYQVAVATVSRGNEYASRAMSLLSEVADRHHVWLQLESAANLDKDGLTDEQLFQWYADLATMVMLRTCRGNPAVGRRRQVGEAHGFQKTTQLRGLVALEYSQSKPLPKGGRNAS